MYCDTSVPPRSHWKREKDIVNPNLELRPVQPGLVYSNPSSQNRMHYAVIIVKERVILYNEGMIDNCPRKVKIQNFFWKTAA